MTIKQYIVHLINWILYFPRWSRDTHCTTGVVGSGKYTCLVCDYIETDEEIIEMIEADE